MGGGVGKKANTFFLFWLLDFKNTVNGIKSRSYLAQRTLMLHVCDLLPKHFSILTNDRARKVPVERERIDMKKVLYFVERI